MTHLGWAPNLGLKYPTRVELDNLLPAFCCRFCFQSCWNR